MCPESDAGREASSWDEAHEHTTEQLRAALGRQTTVGSPEWFERRAHLWTKDAQDIVTRLREYEHDHPSARHEGVPCLFDALRAAEKACGMDPADV